MILDFTAFNRGQCDVVGRGIAVDRSTVLGGDYFKVTGDITGSTIRCTLPDGQVVQSVSHHQLFDVAQYNYAAMIVGRITGPGEVDVTGFNDGPQGKADLNGTFVFTTP